MDTCKIQSHMLALSDITRAYKEIEIYVHDPFQKIQNTSKLYKWWARLWYYCTYEQRLLFLSLSSRMMWNHHPSLSCYLQVWSLIHSLAKICSSLQVQFNIMNIITKWSLIGINYGKNCWVGEQKVFLDAVVGWIQRESEITIVTKQHIYFNIM